MADHVHKQIRAALVTALTGLTTSGARVYANRLYPMDAANLPGLRVFLYDESVVNDSLPIPALLQREIIAAVECCARAASGLDDTLDLMSKEVEVALANGIGAGGKTLNPILVASRHEDEPADVPVGIKRLDFRIRFATLSSTPDTFL